MTEEASRITENVEALQRHLVSVGTGGFSSQSYEQPQKELVRLPQMKPHLPDVVRGCRNEVQFCEISG